MKESIYARTVVGKKRYYARALESVHHYLIRVLKIPANTKQKSKTIFSTHNHNINNIVLLFFSTIIIDNHTNRSCRKLTTRRNKSINTKVLN